MNRLSTIVVLLLGLSNPITSVANTVPSPTVERSLVIGGQGYFPVAVKLRDGRIGVVLRGGAEHLGIGGRLEIVSSADDGKTWSKPTVVVDSPADDRNPAFGQAADGTLVVGFWRTETYDEKGKYDPKLDKPRTTWATRSTDGGKTWSEPAAIDVSDIGLGSPFGRIISLADGALLMAIYGYEVRPAGDKNDSNRNHSYVYRSTDHGQTWKRISEIGDGKLQLNETSLLQLPSGKIHAAARSRAGEVWLAESGDAGRSWSSPRQLTPVNVYPADLCLLADGRMLMTLGNRVGPFGVLGIVSDREGQFDWDRRFNLVTDAISRDCGYPSSVALGDGRVLTAYYATRVTEHPEWRVHCGALIYRP